MAGQGVGTDVAQLYAGEWRTMCGYLFHRLVGTEVAPLSWRPGGVQRALTAISAYVGGGNVRLGTGWLAGWLVRHCSASSQRQELFAARAPHVRVVTCI